MKLLHKFAFLVGVGSIFLLSSNTVFAGLCTAGDYTYINAGGSATIGWDVSGGACGTSVSPNDGSVSGWTGTKDGVSSGGINTNASANGTYSLYCGNAGDNATCHVVVCGTGYHAVGSSCVSNNCSSLGGVSWGACTGSGGTANDGQTITVYDSTPNDTGQADYSCSLGSWSGPTNTSCVYTDPNDCAAQTVNWGSCSGSIAARTNGNTAPTTDSTGPYTGSATFQCTTGSFVYQSGTCTCSAASINISSHSWSPSSATAGAGTFSTLAWNTSAPDGYGYTCSESRTGSVAKNYSALQGPFPTPGTYNSTLTCTNACGTPTADSKDLTIAPPDQPPIGTLDSVTSGNMLTCGVTAGWTFDPDASSSSIGVHFYIDGAAGVGTRFPGAGEITTATSSADVNATYGITGTHRFDDYRITGLAPGSHTLYAYGHGTVTQAADALLTPAGGVAFTCTNNPPVVNAGPDKQISNPVSTSSPSGASATDSDGTIVSTVWSFVSGPGPTPVITGSTTLTPSFSGMTTDGSYVFRLTATDDQGTAVSDTMTVKRVTDGKCAPLHFSCAAGASANNQTPASPAAGRDWTWNCNSTNGGSNDSCSETGYWLMTSITQTGGSAGTITPGPGNILYASNTNLTVTISPSGYVIPPTGSSSALLSKGVDGATTTVNGTTPVPLTNNFTMSTDHYVAATLYVPDPITTNISSTSTYLGDNVVLSWTTDGNRCNLYNWNGTVLVKSIGAVASSPTVNTVTLTQSDLPQTVGGFGYIMRCDDSGDINRGIYDASFNINLWCPRDPVSYVGNPAKPAAPATCTNANPAGSISYTSGGLLLGPNQAKVAVGQSIVFTSAANDTTLDFNAHQFEWRHQENDGSWLWSWLPPSRGSVTYSTPDIFTETGTDTISATFTPSASGVYWVRFVMRDDMLNGPPNTPDLSYIVSPPNNQYFTSGGRLTYTSEFKVDVTGVGASFTPNANGSVDWQCYGAEYVSLVGTKASNPDDVVVPYRTILPFKNTPAYQFGLGYGSFTPKTGYSYTLLCETVDDSATAYYSSVVPTLTLNSTTTTSVNIGWDCNSPLAKGVTLEREYGMYPTSIQSTSTAAYLDSGLTPNTDYTYTLKCYDDWVGGVAGRLLGTAQLTVRTGDNFDPTPIVIDAYIREKVTDPTGVTTATTTTGAFYDWHYEIASGTAVSCTMQQRNDNGTWYPEPGYDTNTSGYTMKWSDIFQADRTAFVNSFIQKHDWKVTCRNSIGSATTKTWTLVKQQPSIPVIDTITEGTLPVIADVTLHCSPAATSYSITHATAPTQSGAGLGTVGAISWSPTVSGNYTITCDDGPPLVIYIDPTMWDPFFRLSGTQRTVGGTVSTMLTWDISNPDNSCNLSAEVSTSSCATLAGAAQAACLASRNAAQTSINTNFLDESNNSILTDLSDPNGQRPLSEALTSGGYLTPNARGRMTVTGIRYTTTFIGQCASGTPSRYKVSVVKENEG